MSVAFKGEEKKDSNANNHQKYENYRVQISRLTSSRKGRFYLEAIFNEYAIMEDRLKSVLRHAGKWHPKDGILSGWAYTFRRSVQRLGYVLLRCQICTSSIIDDVKQIGLPLASP